MHEVGNYTTRFRIRLVRVLFLVSLSVTSLFQLSVWKQLLLGVIWFQRLPSASRSARSINRPSARRRIILLDPLGAQ